MIRKRSTPGSPFLLVLAVTSALAGVAYAAELPRDPLIECHRALKAARYRDENADKYRVWSQTKVESELSREVIVYPDTERWPGVYISTSRMTYRVEIPSPRYPEGVDRVFSKLHEVYLYRVKLEGDPVEPFWLRVRVGMYGSSIRASRSLEDGMDRPDSLLEVPRLPAKLVSPGEELGPKSKRVLRSWMVSMVVSSVVSPELLSALALCGGVEDSVIASLARDRLSALEARGAPAPGVLTSKGGEAAR